MKSNRPDPDTSGLDSDRLPAHVAIIMDGNGRWAKRRSLDRLEGHRRGVETIETIIRFCRNIGLAHLTLFAFSTENWSRPAYEVAGIMTLLKEFLRTRQEELRENGIRFNAVGNLGMLSEDVRQVLDEAGSLTADCRKMVLTIALSYGGRDEIIRAVKRIAADAVAGRIDIDGIDEQQVAAYLDTHDLPDPDVLIRTSGEMRISNFLLWQLAYTEIFVTNTFWPDFGPDELVRILKEYQTRERRFGKV
ncbi:MAG: isoprenyl transferase [Thermodesulfobacteriota bacterium]